MDTVGITSPVERWPGKAYLKRPIPLADVYAVEEALERMLEIDSGLKPAARRREINRIVLPAVLRCYERFELQGLDEIITIDNYPGDPKIASEHLGGWLFDVVMKAYRGDALEIPLATSEQL
jgi:hypothetical protein